MSASRLERPTDQAGYWSVIARVSDTTSNITSTHAAMASGDCTIRCQRRCGSSGDLSRPLKWNQAAQQQGQHRAAEQDRGERRTCHSGNEFDHGTPKLETYHQPLTVANDSATTNSTRAANIDRLRRDFIAAAVTATAASAPSDPASPANTPKWWVHLVGVNIIARNEMMVMPMMRRLGPAAVPGMRPLRSVIASDTASATSRRQHREASRHRAVRARR